MTAESTLARRRGDGGAQMSTAVVRLRRVPEGVADSASARTPLRERVGGRPNGLNAPVTTFEDVCVRAARLVQWAQDELTYLGSHSVSLFSSEDVAGRNFYAAEALYELLPRLLRDVSALRNACGPGELTAEARSRSEEASRAVQHYVARWRDLRDGVQSTSRPLVPSGNCTPDQFLG